MPLVSHNPFPRHGPPSHVDGRFNLRGLPTEARAAVFEHLDARAMNTLLDEGHWNDALLTEDFDRAARGLVQRAEHAPLGSWPARREWRVLADHAGDVRDRCPHAALLSNLWTASSRFAAGELTADQAVYRAPIPDVALDLCGSRVLQAAGRRPDLIARAHAPNEGATLVSANGEVRNEPALAHWQFAVHQCPFMCESVDSMPLEDAPARPFVVHDRNHAKCGLYLPATRDVVALPDVLARCYFAATSANGRYVFASSQDGGLLLLHDRDNATTHPLEYPASLRDDGPPWQLSVDSEGVAFIAAGDKGFRMTLGMPTRTVDLDRRWSNFRLTADERYVVVNDATGTNLRLESRQGGASKTLLHPASDASVQTPRKILAIASSPGLAFFATTCDDGSLCVYDLTGTEHDGKLDPVLHMPLRMEGRRMQNAVPWFDPDGSALRVAYTGMRNVPNDRTVQLMRLPLV